MLRKRKSKIFLLLLITILLLTGCKDKNTDAYKFKEEFESLNNSLTKVNISEDNPFVYTNDIYNAVENEKALVIFCASPKDEESRKIVESIIDYSSKHGLSKIYYINIDETDNLEIGGVKIEKIPSLIGIIRKQVTGVVNDKDSINTIIDPVITELSSCDIEQGC